ncbi:MAG TPA: 2Fe-2S iron-sulfur cluster-binding protein [Candidatus Acidoferrales bacterium]|nr:2Fe-2S iron-sulfur cluster-binding protein [Candidatus Acidoferrales bacterium]
MPEALNGRDEFTRREFVAAVGAFTGGAVLSAPGLNGQAGAATEPLASSNALAVPTDIVINGRRQKFLLDPRTTLLDLLRENLGLTGTKKGCDHGQCGACTVLSNGRRINSCLSLAVSHHNDEITTIEGIASGDQLHPVQAAFLEHDGFQCGYCTPGQICSAVALLQEAKEGEASIVTADLSKEGAVELTKDEIRERMSGNICRCGAYPGIVEAVEDANRRVSAPGGTNR